MISPPGRLICIPVQVFPLLALKSPIEFKVGLPTTALVAILIYTTVAFSPESSTVEEEHKLRPANLYTVSDVSVISFPSLNAVPSVARPSEGVFKKQVFYAFDSKMPNVAVSNRRSYFFINT